MARLQKKKKGSTRKKKKSTASAPQLSPAKSAGTKTSTAVVREKKKRSLQASGKSSSRNASISGKKGKNYLDTGIQFLREVWIELKKVTWPSRKQTMGSTLVMIILVMIISLFLGMVKSASIAHLKLEDIEARIYEVKESLLLYEKYANELTGAASQCLEQATSSFTGLADPAYYEAKERLTAIYAELIAMRELGVRIDNELNAIPILAEKFRGQKSLHSVHLAKELDFLRLNELSQFKKALNRVRSMIMKLES